MSLNLFRLYTLVTLFFSVIGCSLFGIEIKTLYANSQLVDCVGIGPRKCMEVRETPMGEWAYFYDGIEGFTLEEDYLYTLKVKISNVPNPPADAFSKHYRLLELISKEKI